MKIITVICWAIAALALAGLAIWFLTGTVFSIGSDELMGDWNIGLNWERLTGPYEVVGTYTVPISGIDSLDIDWVAGEIIVLPYNGEEISITESAQRELNDDERLRIGTSGATLTIKYSAMNMRRMPQKRLEVLVPHALSVNMGTFKADSSSGSITVSDFSANAFRAGSVSGAVQLTNITARMLSTSTTSGSIALTSVYADDMKLSSVSGSVRLSDTGAKTLDCNTTSGSINLFGDFGSADLNSIGGRITMENAATYTTVKADSTSGAIDLAGSFASADLGSISGSISIRSEIVPSSLKAGTTSGAIAVTIPNEGPVSVNHSSVSGKLTSDIPLTMQSNGAQFRLSTVSGEARILMLVES